MLPANAELIQNSDLSELSGLGDHDCLQIVATKDISVGEEILINYTQSTEYEIVKSWFGAEKNIIESKTTKPTGSSPITEIEDIQETVQETAMETRLDLMEAKDLEEIITQSLDKLEKFKNDSVRYGWSEVMGEIQLFRNIKESKICTVCS